MAPTTSSMPSPGPTATAAVTSASAPQVWDPKTQEMHGGQTWRFCENFHADFSVTTSPLGTQEAPLAAAKATFENAHHYPPADAAEARSALAALIDIPVAQVAIGNGASEFIDLIMRLAPQGPFRPGPFVASYREYHRAARVANREILEPKKQGSQQEDDGKQAAINVVIRPNSPTGELLSLDEVEDMLQDKSTSPDSVFVFDESFLPFAGSEWNKLSATKLIEKYPTRVLVIHSWTKIWGCAALRLGTMTGSLTWMSGVRAAQTPWSCNAAAQAFAVVAAADTDYLDETRSKVSAWRKTTLDRIRGLWWVISSGSVDWAPWVFVKCPGTETARRAIAVAQKAGCPVRPCDSYGMSDYLRIAVRQPHLQDELFGALEKEFGLHSRKQ